MVDGGPGWDPGVLSPRAQAQPAAARERLALAAGLRVPLILACGGRAGFVSEPLVLRERAPRVGATGPRVVGATPAGEALALDDHIATAIPAPGLVGLTADGERLRLVVSADGEPPLAIEWTATGGPGWGTTAPAVAWQEWRAEQPGALAGLAWAAGSELAAVTVAGEQRAALLAAAAGDGIARLALRRLLSLPSAPAGPLAEQPPWLARDIALRDLGRGHLAAGSAAALALVAGEDDWIVAVAIRSAQGPHRARLLDLLAERLRAQAAGRLPFATDPLLQHRLVAAVFDAADLGPTPLRPLAVALRQRLDGFARGPVERFLARHGEVRPAKR
jgi:hypothetical protein